MKLKQTYIDDEFNHFFEYPYDDKSQVSGVSAKLFVGANGKKTRAVAV